MSTSAIIFKTLAALAAALVSTAAFADQMSPSMPQADCLSRAATQLTLDQNRCVASYPASTQLYGACITSANQAYVSATIFCRNVSGTSSHLIKLKGLRGGETRGATSPILVAR